MARIDHSFSLHDQGIFIAGKAFNFDNCACNREDFVSVYKNNIFGYWEIQLTNGFWVYIDECLKTKSYNISIVSKDLGIEESFNFNYLEGLFGVINLYATYQDEPISKILPKSTKLIQEYLQ